MFGDKIIEESVQRKGSWACCGVNMKETLVLKEEVQNMENARVREGNRKTKSGRGDHGHYAFFEAMVDRTHHGRGQTLQRIFPEQRRSLMQITL